MINKNLSKIAIGTAQWGMNYGISNKEGKTTKQEVSKILDLARIKGIDTLDTANSYGNAEKIIGDLRGEEFKVITKIAIGIRNKDKEKGLKTIDEQINKSIINLGKTSLDTVLVHDPRNLKGEGENTIAWNRLEDMKRENIIKKLGISVYSTQEAEILAEKLNPDIIQIPLNVFDQRAIDDGTLKKLKKQGIEIHARSIFLQGLLLLKPDELRIEFKQWRPEIIKWANVCKEMQMSQLEVALSFIYQQKEIDKCIIGIANHKQLKEITISLKNDMELEKLAILKTKDVRLINPTKWKC